MCSPDSFETLLEAHRRELEVHCYRMLGSWIEAEDVFQEVSLRAWRGLESFEGRSSMRSWLYRIATNACLTALGKRSARSLPEMVSEAAPVGVAPAPPEEERNWVEPFPWSPGPEMAVAPRAFAWESVSLAFVLALQELPPRQRAVLLLRDVVGYEAKEVAEILDASVPAVNSTLVRARERMERFRRRHGDEPKIDPLDASRKRLLERYVEAWEAGDVEALVSLLSRDATFSMPPVRTWFRGREAIAALLRDSVFAGGRSFRVRSTSANGRPAFAFYSSGPPCLPTERGAVHGESPHSIQMVWLDGERIGRIVSFLNRELVLRFRLGALRRREPREIRAHL